MKRFLIIPSIDPFNKILILEYTTEIIVCFFTLKSRFEEIKQELEKYGEVRIINEYNGCVDVEVHIKDKDKRKVSKVLKVLSKIPLLEIGVPESKIREFLKKYFE